MHEPCTRDTTHEPTDGLAQMADGPRSVSCRLCRVPFSKVRTKENERAEFDADATKVMVFLMCTVIGICGYWYMGMIRKEFQILHLFISRTRRYLAGHELSPKRGVKHR